MPENAQTMPDSLHCRCCRCVFRRDVDAPCSAAASVFSAGEVPPLDGREEEFELPVLSPAGVETQFVFDSSCLTMVSNHQVGVSVRGRAHWARVNTSTDSAGRRSTRPSVPALQQPRSSLSHGHKKYGTSGSKRYPNDTPRKASARAREKARVVTMRAAYDDLLRTMRHVSNFPASCLQQNPTRHTILTMACVCIHHLQQQVRGQQ